jgi:hypothetical protein
VWQLTISKGKGKARAATTIITTDSDGDVMMRETVIGTKPEAGDSKPEDSPYDLCICGMDAQVAPKQIGCSNMVNERGDSAEITKD